MTGYDWAIAMIAVVSVIAFLYNADNRADRTAVIKLILVLWAVVAVCSGIGIVISSLFHIAMSLLKMLLGV